MTLFATLQVQQERVVTRQMKFSAVALTLATIINTVSRKIVNTYYELECNV